MDVTFSGCRAPSAVRDFFLAIGGRQADAAVVQSARTHPIAYRRLSQVHFTCHGANRLALVKHQTNHAGFALVSELAARRFGVSAIAAQRSILLWKDVHAIGSSLLRIHPPSYRRPSEATIPEDDARIERAVPAAHASTPCASVPRRVLRQIAVL